MRNEKMATDHDLMIDIDPDILQAFRQSNTVNSKYSQPAAISLVIHHLLLLASHGTGH